MFLEDGDRWFLLSAKEITENVERNRNIIAEYFEMERQKSKYLKNMFANVYIQDVVERNKTQNVDVGIVDAYEKNREGKRVHKQLEVDFVVNQGSQRYYIQVAYDMTSEEKQTQELHSLRNIPDSFKKMVIVCSIS